MPGARGAVPPDVSGPFGWRDRPRRRFGEVRRFPAGDLLFRAGETVPEMYVILSGRIATKPYDLVDVNVDIASFDVNLNGKVCGKSNGRSGGKKK